MSLRTIEHEKSPKEIKEELRKYHEASLANAGAPEGFYIPKMAYRPSGKSELHISFFPSEVKKEEDLYVEFTSRELVPEDPERKLWKWKFNPHYDEEYEKVQNKDGVDFRYLVPVEELKLISHVEFPIVEEQEVFQLPDPEHDLPLDQLTIRDLAAIMLKKPVSRKSWLNEIING